MALGAELRYRALYPVVKPLGFMSHTLINRFLLSRIILIIKWALRVLWFLKPCMRRILLLGPIFDRGYCDHTHCVVPLYPSIHAEK